MEQERAMPSSYETHTTTTTAIQFHPDYLRTIPGILKVVECVLCLIVIICASIVWWFSQYGGGWVLFVSIMGVILTTLLLIAHLFQLIRQLPEGPWAFVILSLITFILAVVNHWGVSQNWVESVAILAFITTVIDLCLHLFNLISRFPGPWLLIEFIYYFIFTVFFLIAAVVSAASGNKHNSIAAAAFFAFSATAVYAVDTFFQFRAWRTGQSDMFASPTTTTTTTRVERRELKY